VHGCLLSIQLITPLETLGLNEHVSDQAGENLKVKNAEPGIFVTRFAIQRGNEYSLKDEDAPLVHGSSGITR
jgi:hypothetical protein